MCIFLAKKHKKPKIVKKTTKNYQKVEKNDQKLKNIKISILMLLRVVFKNIN